MKRILTVLLAVLMLFPLACQPTPEEDIVFNRGDTDVDTIVAASPLPENDISQSDDPVLIQGVEGQNPVFPTRYENEIVNDSTSLIIDAEVITNGLTSYPVYEAKRGTFDAEQVRAVASEIITDIVGYRDGTGFVKSDYPMLLEKAAIWGNEEILQGLSQQMQEAEDVKYEETAELRIDNSPKDQAYLRSDGHISEISISSERLIISRIFSGDIIQEEFAEDIDIIEGREPIPVAPEITREEAETVLTGFLERVGMEGYTAYHTEPARYQSYATSEELSMGWYFKLVKTFEYYPISGEGKDGENGGFLQSRDEEKLYFAPWAPELVEVYIDGEGVAYFRHFSPMEVTRKVNENVQLTDFDTVTKSAMNLFSATLAWYQREYEKDKVGMAYYAKIEKIILTLTLQQAKDRQDVAYLLPTWVFFVDIHSKPELGFDDTYQEAYGFSAIDGSRVTLDKWG
ncbi:MAG: DUF6034 family protein [Clostridia bacterium]|nr:DUF6034 family protein [Clostridia bacterium]